MLETLGCLGLLFIFAFLHGLMVRFKPYSFIFLGILFVGLCVYAVIDSNKNPEKYEKLREENEKRKADIASRKNYNNKESNTNTKKNDNTNVNKITDYSSMKKSLDVDQPSNVITVDKMSQNNVEMINRYYNACNSSSRRKTNSKPVKSNNYSLNINKAKQPYDERFALYVLASGSKGNSAVIQDLVANKLYVIDCGISAKQLFDRSESLGLDLNNVDKILLTHEHNDHVRGLRVLLNRLDKMGCYPDVYMNVDCYENYKEKDSFVIDLIPVVGLGTINSGDVLITPFQVPHDSVDCYGYRFDCENDAICYVSDIGDVSPRNLRILEDCRILGLEFNYDEDMLINGDYPDFLKERIMSGCGHLSNEEASRTLKRICNKHLESLVCLHRSEKYNMEDLIIESIGDSLSAFPNLNVVIAKQDKPIVIY